jgi:hypothetical protein
MNEELIKKYQEAISLLHYRKPNNRYLGEFTLNEDNKTAFKLTRYTCSNDDLFTLPKIKTKTFKYFDSKEDALKYFIKMAQNRVF